MALIEWKDAYSVGVPAVDEEHREMIDLINTLYGNMRSDGQDPDVMAFLGEIYARIAAHFALEELLMQRHEYDEYREHKLDHEHLLEEIRNIMDDYEDGRVLDDDDLANRLDAWFSEHFRTRDARLHNRLG
ncbi:MAG: bacteriohemerythrin [Gammaproteobacteria bacterium]|nr:bacteriohemerythrin [Gammaproteobacteria bacterium]